MVKNFQSIDEVVADEAFLGWYFKESEEKINSWENWMVSNPAFRSLVEEAIEFMNNLSQHEKNPATEQVEAKLLQLHTRMNEPAAPVVAMRTSTRRWWMSAAAVILLVVGGYTFFQLFQPREKLDTSFGEVKNNQLPDGSTMILNANSTAQLSEGWEDGKDREVWLNGEAFFKVTKTKQKTRFIVHTGKLDVIVTGTQFNVLNRDNKTTVLLTEGSVIIRTKDGKELAMKPGDYIEMGDQLAIERKEAKEENVLAWKDNKLAFDHTSLKEVAQTISNHYGIKVTVADEAAAARSVTGIMPNNNIDDLLKAIEVAFDIRVTRSDKEIIFSTNK